MNTIMILEDDFETQLLFSEILSSEGYDVVSARDSSEAADAIQQDVKPDLIFMDLNFPGGTPEEFASKLHGNHDTVNIPLYLVSGKADIADYAKKLRAQGYLKKPFDIDELLNLVKQAL